MKLLSVIKVNQEKKVKPVLKHILIFFGLAYLWSWAWWIPVVSKLYLQGASMNTVPAWIIPFVLIGAYGPSLAAVVVTTFTSGRNGLNELLRKLLIWKASAKVHFMVWLGHPMLITITILFYISIFGSIGTPDWTRLKLIPMVFLTGVIFGPLAEELGWRGYALPKLQTKYSPLVSSLVIGVAWCSWHAPLFWAPAGTLMSGQEVTFLAVGKYLLFTCGLSILFTWVASNSKGSVLLAIAFHMVINASIPLLLFPSMSSDTSLSIKWLTLIPVWVVAIGLIVAGKLKTNGLSKPAVTQQT